ncbi:MAG: hypothetical protein AB1391_02065 [Candidatus Micrarchaeota archaeon]
MLHYFTIILICTIFFSFLITKILIPQLIRVGITGQDLSKQNKPEIAEMGGIGIIAGFSIGVIIAIFFNTFLGFNFDLNFILAALIAIFILTFIGFIDDLLDIPQMIKAFLPLFAAVPLIAVKAAGSTSMHIPFFGIVDFGIFYFFVLIPAGIAVSANLTNMLAGFNGLEAGMGIILALASTIVAFHVKSTEALILYISLFGALFGFIIHNKYPSKIFPGDVGTLIIGATIAAGAIIGNFESIAALFMSLYIVDFFIKLRNGFPKTPGVIKNEKLYAPENKIRGLVQLPMVLLKGIKEQDLVLLFISAQITVSIIVLVVFNMGM